MDSRERVLYAFESKIFSIKIEGTSFSGKVSDHSNLNILTSKQILQKSPVALAQVKAFYLKNFFKKKIIQQYNEFNTMDIIFMDTIFMNSENSKTSDPHRLLLNLLD